MLAQLRLWVYNAEIFSGGSSNLWKPVGFVAKQNSDFWVFWDTLLCKLSIIHLIHLLLDYFRVLAPHWVISVDFLVLVDITYRRKKIKRQKMAV